jgi:hypothetical protein
MSTALSGVFGLSPWLDVRGMVQLGLLAVFQADFSHFYEVTKEMLEERNNERRIRVAKDANLILAYQITFYQLFGGTFEDIALPNASADGEGRHSCYQPTPVGLNWERLANNSTERNSLVDELLFLLKQVNELVSGRLVSSCQEILDTANAQIERNFKFDLGTFRLLLFVQFCAHVGVVIEPGVTLREMIYPIKGTFAYERIERIVVKDKGGLPDKVGLRPEKVEEKVHEICRFLQSELSTSSRRVFMDEIETMLWDDCEEGHVSELDTFIKGQSLFRLDDEGTPLVKPYGHDSAWTRVPLVKDYVD